MDSNKILQHAREKGGSVKRWQYERLKMEKCDKLTLEECILTLVKRNQTCNFFTQTIFMWMCVSGVTSDFTTTSCITCQSALSFINMITTAALPFIQLLTMTWN